eukprot:scaffold1291_cov256-Pinguiococcus_pyrenoidosus.AAC.8
MLALQVKYLVREGCIQPLCDLLDVGDSKIVKVALEGLENILRMGAKEAQENGTGENQMANLIHEEGGLDKIEGLQVHELEEIYHKAVQIIETYFGVEFEDDEQLAPNVSADGTHYEFGQGMGGTPQFNFQG